MSRVGKKPIEILKGATITVSDDNTITVKGPLGELSRKIVTDQISVNIEDELITLTRSSEDKQTRSYHGLYRMLIANMVKGVTEGFTIKQELVGVGYRAEATNQQLKLALGYSHDIVFVLPQEIKVETLTEKGKNPIVTLKSYDNELLGLVAAKIRSFRAPEPYKGKGVRFVGEVVRRKASKSGKK